MMASIYIIEEPRENLADLVLLQRPGDGIGEELDELGRAEERLVVAKLEIDVARLLRRVGPDDRVVAHGGNGAVSLRAPLGSAILIDVAGFIDVSKNVRMVTRV